MEIKSKSRGRPNIRVAAGSVVSIVNLETGEQLEFKIVSAMKEGERFEQLSTWSPLGQSLIGRRVGESVYVQVRSGTVRYQILKITEQE